jgi:hypothetical protein
MWRETMSIWLRMRDRLDGSFQALKRAIDCLSKAPGGCRAAPQVGSNQQVGSSSSALWHNGVSRQFDLNGAIVNAVGHSAVEIDERCPLGASGGNLNAWSFGGRVGIVCHDGSHRGLKWNAPQSCWLPDLESSDI